MRKKVFKTRNDLHKTKMTESSYLSRFCCRSCVDRSRHSYLMRVKKTLRDHRNGTIENYKGIWHRPLRGTRWVIDE